MNKDVIIVPTFTRPEMLWNCLEHLARCVEVSQCNLWIAVDSHTNHNHIPPPLGEIGEIAARFFDSLRPRTIVQQAHGYWGNSFNVLTSYFRAYADGYRYVFLVEDDVMVEKDFFNWHYTIQEVAHPFCSVGVANGRSGKLLSKVDYASLGVCFPRESLKPILEHCNSQYFSYMENYCRSHFPDKFNNEFPEQDGLILRVMDKIGGVAVFPEVPVAQHIGWYGYNRPSEKRPKGSLVERYEEVKARSRATVS